ncbi:hypothetical protein DW266_10265 [Blautia sp. AM22-22LB]|jgi:hypothetical protein|nr:hypothetical protein DW266_10265 [Blautia sp. AM22-22LB]RHU42993.1 hypothetical protein DXD15_11585 [Blautia sp. TF11-31AT]
MLVKGKCVFLNSDKKQGIKDPTKTYYSVLLMQGTETLNCGVSEEIYNKELPQMNQFESVECGFDFNPTFKSMRLVDIRKVSK